MKRFREKGFKCINESLQRAIMGIIRSSRKQQRKSQKDNRYCVVGNKDFLGRSESQIGKERVRASRCVQV